MKRKRKLVIGERLIFHGLAWPTAKAVPVSKADPLRVSDNDRPTGTADRFGVASAASEPAGTDLTQFAKALQDFPTFGSVSRQNSHSRSLMLTAPSGHGRPWQADAPEAFWRDFAALNLSSDADGMVAFVRRRGDPEGLLNRPGASADSGRWRTPLHNGLRYFAACWTEADEQGVSHCNRDPHDAVEWWQLRLFPAISPQIEPQVSAWTKVRPKSEGNPCSSTSFGTSSPPASRVTAKSRIATPGSFPRRGVA